MPTSCLTPDSSPVLCAMGMFSGRYFGILSLTCCLFSMSRIFSQLLLSSMVFSKIFCRRIVMSLGVVRFSRPLFLASKSIIFLWSIVFFSPSCFMYSLTFFIPTFSMVMLVAVLSLMIIIRVSMSMKGSWMPGLNSFRIPIPPTLSSFLSVMGSSSFMCPSRFCLKASTSIGIFIMLAAGNISSPFMSISSPVSRILMTMPKVPSTLLMMSMISLSSLVGSVKGLSPV